MLLGSCVALADNRSECQPLPEVVTPPADAATIPYAQGLLFEIEGEQITSSYIFGTMHVADPDIVNLPKEVNDAFARSQSFVMEALFDEKSVAELMHSMVIEQGPTLDRSLTPQMFDTLASLLERYDLSRPVAARLQPWAAFQTLSMPPQKGGTPLDLVLMRRAQTARLPVQGLETLQEQTKVMSEMSRADQLSMLKEVICHYPIFQRETVEAKAAYRDRQLGRLLTMTTQHVHEGDPTQRLLDRLLWTRNVHMADRLAPLLTKGNVFIAIGALHLVGERGVLALLSTRGYRVSRRY
jgi:uncharacterized protein